MDELQKKNNIVDGSYNTARTEAINRMYDAQKTAREQELKSAYEQSLSAQQQAQDKIAPQYQQSANDLSTQYERNRRNFNQQAAGNGINTGTASQAALAQNNEYLRAFGGLRTSESEAIADSERKKAELAAQYERQKAAAAAENAYNLSGALLNEYNNAYNRDLQNAQIAAQYGDFSLFSNLYGKEQADAMLALWKAQNPDLAYNTGRITADEYYVMTGRRPEGWTATGGLSLKDLVDGKLPVRASAPASGGGIDNTWGWVANPYTAAAKGGWDPGNHIANSVANTILNHEYF